MRLRKLMLMRLLIHLCMLLAPFWGLSAFGFEVMTYNVGLAYGYVDFAQERRNKLVHHLKERDVDLLCLQEVWSKEDQDYFARELGYPYVSFGPIDQELIQSSPACHLSDLFGEQGVLSCVWSKCRNQSGSDLTACTLNSCVNELEWLASNRSECSQVLSAQVGVSPMISIFRMLNPFWRSGRFAYKGSVGLLLLSKVPFVREEIYDMQSLSTTTHRGALLVQIKEGQRDLFVGCTHLTADLENVPYAGRHHSWEMENLVQINALIKKMGLFAATQTQMVMGDFNCGFSGNQLDSMFEKSCGEFLKNGYLEPMLNDEVHCTFCSHNSLTKGASNVWIDHIFMKNLPGSEQLRMNLEMQQPIRLTLDGRSVPTYLSDHFGISLQIE